MDTASQKKSMPVRGTRVTATISVAMVLFLIGLAATAGIMAHNVVKDIRQQLGFVVVMKDTATPADISRLKDHFGKVGYVNRYEYTSAEDVKARWQKTLHADEDINELLGDINPFSPEFEVFVTNEYATAGALRKVIESVAKAPGVDIVTARTSMADKVNKTVRRLTIIIAGVAVLLLIIAIVLINNTVRLTIFSQRFLIHTMQLVGASNGFIRRPILWTNILTGVIAAVIAIALLSALFGYGMQNFPEIDTFLSWGETAIVSGSMLAAGILLCVLTAFAATNKYLRKSYDEMF